MSHDKVVNYIDIDLKDALSENAREHLLALHYASIQNARQAGIREGLKEHEKFGGDAAVTDDALATHVPGLPPTPPLGRIIEEHAPHSVAWGIVGSGIVLSVVVALAYLVSA